MPSEGEDVHQGVVRKKHMALYRVGKCRDMNITVCTWVSEGRTASVGTFAQLTGSMPGPSMSLSVLDIVMSSKDKALALSTKLFYF